jgi:hypothetical protein
MTARVNLFLFHSRYFLPSPPIFLHMQSYIAWYINVREKMSHFCKLCNVSLQNSTIFTWLFLNFINYKTIILPVVLYACETLPLALREQRPKLFENRLLRRIFGPTRPGIIRAWRKLHNKELHNLCSSPNIIWMIKSRNMRWSGYVARMGKKRTHIGCW